MNETTLYEETILDDPLSDRALAVEDGASSAPEEASSQAESPSAKASEEDERIKALEERCLAAESALADSLAFASLWAPYATVGARVEEDPHYRHFLSLRGKGLTVEEAFAAATAGSLGRAERDAPSKAHLFSGAPSGRAFRSQASSEEMAIARELLGEGYSPAKLEQLFRRVTKGS